MADELRVTPEGLTTAAHYFGDAGDDLRSIAGATRDVESSALPPPANVVMRDLVDDWHDELRRLYEYTLALGQIVHTTAQGFHFTDLEAEERLVLLPRSHGFDAPR